MARTTNYLLLALLTLSTIAMTQSFAKEVEQEELPENSFIKNGDFSQEKTFWSLYVNQKFQTQTTSRFADFKAVFHIPATAKTNHVQLIQLVTLPANKTYQLKFTATAKKEGKLVCTYGQISKPFSSYGLSKTITLSTKRKTYTIEFEAKPFEPGNLPAIRFFLGNLSPRITLENISMVEANKDSDKDESENND